jgi:type I restriction enzyme S subunit
MATWHVKRMDELCEITSSKRIFAADYVSEGVPFYRGREITEKYKGNLDVSTELFITEEKFSEIERKFGAPKTGDLLLTSVGTLGSVYVVKPGDRFYFKDGNLTWFRNFQELDSRFLYYWLGSPQGKAELQKATIGSSQSAFTIVLLKGMEMELPPLPVQRRIAGILSAYDDLMENSQRRIRLLEAMARALYREWFVHFRFPGHQKIKLVDSPLGKIPHGWEVKTVADSFEISGGGTPSRKEAKYWDDGTIQWFVPSGLTGANTMFMDDSPERITELGLAESSARLFPAFSVMLTSRATIGAVAINTHEACTNQGFITGLPNERVPLYFLFHWLTENVPQFERMASGATFKEISRGVFKTIEFLHPAPALVRHFESQVEPMEKQMLALQRQIQNLRRTRDLLLPRLLSGQVSLSVKK